MLPFGRIALKGQKSKTFADTPVTLGEHLKKRRNELGLLQREVAEQLDVDPHSVTDWEKDHKKPEIRFWPALIAFLGYDPHPEPQTLGERLQATYRALGLSRKKAARQLGIDENTLQRYEGSHREPKSVRLRQLVADFLDRGVAALGRAILEQPHRVHDCGRFVGNAAAGVAAGKRGAK